MLMPRRVKHRKVMRGRMSGLAKGGHTVAFGDFGLATLEPAWITSRQIEAARRAMTRSVKRGGKIWIRIFPDKPVTKKPAEVRMGSGKGAPDHWVAVVRPGMFDRCHGIIIIRHLTAGMPATCGQPRCVYMAGKFILGSRRSATASSESPPEETVAYDLLEGRTDPRPHTMDDT